MPTDRVKFTRKMRKDYTILIPNMMPTHFAIVEKVLQHHGYQVRLLKNEGPGVMECGLKYVHNDMCYPALLTTGQMIDALKSGEYDVDRTALLFTQTGGGCRASNYIHLIRKALKKAGLGQVPVISLSAGLEQDSGFTITVSLLRQALAGIVYGDLLMLLNNQVKPYEVVKGQSQKLVELWTARLCDSFADGKGYAAKDMTDTMNQITQEFSAIETENRQCVKVGIVGEIYIKYSALGNNHLEDFLYEQGCEVMVPGLMGFLMYCTGNSLEDYRLYGGSRLKCFALDKVLKYLTKMERFIISALENSRFKAPLPHAALKPLLSGTLGEGCKMGEGWLLTAEMIELIETGYENIVCAQPFGCLPNHIVGKGMIRKITHDHPNANIVPIDYDPGATRVNQENRIKLMLAVAREKLETAPPRKEYRKAALTVS